MPVPISLPDLGTDRAVVSLWFVEPGETVFVGDRIVEVLIPGAVVVVPAPCSGTLHERFAFPGDTMTANQTLGTLEPDPDE